LVFWFIDERQDRIDHVRDGTYPEIKKATFGQYLQHWQSTHLIPEKFKPSTYNGYRSIVEYHLLPAFREYQMQAITAAEINAFTTRLLQANDLEHKRARSGRTTKNILNLLGKIFAKAVSESYLKISPMPGVDRPRINKEQKGRALKPDEIQSILKAAGTKFHPMFATAVATGMRQGEQFGLDWEHIDFANSVIKVRRELYWKFGKYHDKKEGGPTYVFIPPKSKASVRDIDMSPELRKELLELYMKSGKTGLVFCTSKGTPLNPANIVKRDFRKALESAEFERAKNELPGIGKVRWHDLRHTFGSLKIDQGENIYYVMRQMGHSSIQVTIDIYGHQLESRNPQAAAKTDAMIFG
jgi:integrase